ncbi:MAG: TetR-like C-terminal domain-containing protein [Eubacteriales bacterium]|nr:TetR-like C-terminal domain-containing protein [Eubacteriales bacterium]
MRTKKDDRRVKYTKMVLRESLIELLSERDIARITIKEICEKADINRATFYAHYADQYDLLAKIENELFDNLRSYLKGHEQDSYPLNDSEWNTRVGMVADIFDYLRENASLCKILLSDKRNLDFQKRIMMLVYDPYFLQLDGGGVFSEEEKPYVYSFTLTGFVGAVQTWLDNDMAQNSRTIAALLMRLFYRVATGKPEEGRPNAPATEG